MSSLTTASWLNMYTFACCSEKAGRRLRGSPRSSPARLLQRPMRSTAAAFACQCSHPRRSPKARLLRLSTPHLRQQPRCEPQHRRVQLPATSRASAAAASLASGDPGCGAAPPSGLRSSPEEVRPGARPAQHLPGAHAGVRQASCIGPGRLSRHCRAGAGAAWANGRRPRRQ